jgi:hypothetical protein
MHGPKNKIVQEVLSPAINLQRNEVTHSPPYSTEVKNEWSCISILLMFLRHACIKTFVMK